MDVIEQDNDSLSDGSLLDLADSFKRLFGCQSNQSPDRVTWEQANPAFLEVVFTIDEFRRQWEDLQLLAL